MTGKNKIKIVTNTNTSKCSTEHVVRFARESNETRNNTTRATAGFETFTDFHCHCPCPCHDAKLRRCAACVKYLKTRDSGVQLPRASRRCCCCAAAEPFCFVLFFFLYSASLTNRRRRYRFPISVAVAVPCAFSMFSTRNNTRPTLPSPR